MKYLKILKTYFSFKGRLNRKPFLFFYKKIFAVLLALLILSIFDDSNIMRIITALFGWFVAVPLCLVGVTSVPVKRLHDLNLSGRWFLIGIGILFSLDITLRVIEKISPLKLQVAKETIFLLENTAFIIFIPLFICLVILCFKKGVKGNNRYGPDPLSIEPQDFSE